MRDRFLPPVLVLAVFAAACGAASHPATGRALRDVELAARIKTVLLNSLEIDATKIDVRVADGAVTLEGVASSDADARKAVELVRQVPGVSGVTSKVRVARPPAPISRLPRRPTAPS